MWQIEAKFHVGYQLQTATRRGFSHWDLEKDTFLLFSCEKNQAGRKSHCLASPPTQSHAYGLRGFSCQNLAKGSLLSNYFWFRTDLYLL